MRDDEGQSPLDKALDYPYGNDGCVDVALYLMSRGCACGDEDKAKLLCGACQWGKLDVVKELVEQQKVDPRSECAVYLNGLFRTIIIARNLRMVQIFLVFHMQSFCFLASNREY